MRKFLNIVVGAACAVAMVGCGGASTQLGIASNPRVRAVSVLDTPAQVDVVVDSSTLVDNGGFGTGGTRSVIDAGTRQVSVIDSTTQGTLVTEEQLFEENSDYTVVAFRNNGTPDVLTLRDRRTETTGRADLRVIHVASGVGPVDVFVTPVGADLTGLTPTFANVTIADSQVAYISVDPGTYQVRVAPTGTTNVLLSQNITVQAGQARTVLATNNGTEAGLLVLNDLN